MAILYALKSKEGTYVKCVQTGVLLIFDSKHEAEVNNTEMGRPTDTIVEASCSQSINGSNYTQSQAKRMHDILRDMMNTNEEWGEWVYEMHGEIEELLTELEKGE